MSENHPGYPSRLRISDFSYDLPSGYIADFPLSQRDASRLLVVRNGKLTASRFSELDLFLDPESLLVLNNTRVVQARLLFHKESGARIEVFCLNPLNPVTDIERSLGNHTPIEWHCLVGNAKKWKEGTLALTIPFPLKQYPASRCEGIWQQGGSMDAKGFTMEQQGGATDAEGNTFGQQGGSMDAKGLTMEQQGGATDAEGNTLGQQGCAMDAKGLPRGQQGNGELTLYAQKLESLDDGYRIGFSWEPGHLTWGEVLEIAGKTPLPPYIHRDAISSDKHTYQTVYALHEGSVAAPTAGLHFTPRVFEKLSEKSIFPHYLTLHVGAGTFKPVNTESVAEHLMHQEVFYADRHLLELLAAAEQKINCVGTTSMRTLESLYWIGARLWAGYVPGSGPISLSQWFPYSWEGALPSRRQAMNSIIGWIDKKRLGGIQGQTSLIIVPSYPFQMVDSLITNFHQPGSTLLLLVAAFAGPVWREAYQYAIDNHFRFLSYGDSCLFFRTAE